MTEHRDPATGRPYTIGPDGQSRWLDDPTQPAAQPFPAPQPLAGAGHGRPAPTRRGPLVPVLAAGATGVVGLLIGLGIGGSTPTTSDTVTPAGGASSRSSSSRTQAPEPEQTTPPPLTKDDFEITTKTLSKQCFGSAGCNVQVRLAVATSPRAAGVPVEVTVQVTGDESGPTVETISIDEDGSYSAPELALSTKSSKTVVKATITDVEQG